MEEYIEAIEWPEYFEYGFNGYSDVSHISRNVICLQGQDFYTRFMFEKGDSIRVSRGEYPPYPVHGDFSSRIFEVKNSRWLKERYDYEKKHYERSYEFGGNVEEMKLDYRHYFIPMEDDFYEVIARGFWYEASDSPMKSQFQDGNPLANISRENPITISEEEFEGHIYLNQTDIEKLIDQSRYCSQKLLQFGLVVDKHTSIFRTLFLMRNNKNELYCSLKGHLGNEVLRFENKIVGLDEVKDFLVNDLQEFALRRRNIIKNNNS